ncbi:hypothetical protein ACTXT7_011563 [Hymenolepis weldensis]
MSTTNSDIGRRVIIPVDGSINCHRAFKWYVKYIYKKNDFVYFVHVLKPKSIHRDMIVTMDNPPVLAQTVHGFSLDFTDTSAISESYKKLAETAGVNNFKTEILANTSVGEAVLNLAADLQANLIVIGCRDSSNFKRTLLGNVSRYLIVHSSLPVLVVPPSCRRLSSMSS